MSRRDEIIEKIGDVPALPKAAAEVTRLVQDPDVSQNKLAQAIQYDPGLTGNLLKVANSAYFAGPRKISSIKEALTRLGMNRVHQLVIATVAAKVAKQAVAGYDLPPGDLWGHSVAVAVGAEQAAAVLEKRAPDHAFTAGLLHDIGKVVMGTFIKVDVDPLLEAMEKGGLSFEEAEKQVLGIDHAEVGATLLAEWGLPGEITDVVKHHHRPDDFDGDLMALDLVHLADVLSMTSGIGIGIDGLRYKSSVQTAARLALKPRVMEAIVCRTLCEMDDVRKLFGG